MYQGLRSITYKVADIEKARNWYGKVFDAKPSIDLGVAVNFSIGNSHLALNQAEDAATNSDDSVIAYWEVDDIESEYKRLLRLGAKVHTEISTVLNIKRAVVIDPFGNIFGIRATIADAAGQSVAQKPSQTAMGVATARAVAAVEDREEIRGHDYLAEIFLPEDRKAALKNVAVMKQVMASRMPGMYEYIVARTAYFDDIVEAALRENISQLVFLGAGYDTRPYRFSDLIKDTKIFELDMQTTQQHKMQLLQENNVSIPEQLSFVPIDFNTETIADALFKAGYAEDQNNIFIWEGVTYYLSPKAVDDTLASIKSTSSVGSTVCLDYSAHWPGMFEAYGVKNLMETMRDRYSGENTRFGIERGRTESFFAERGYEISGHLTAEEMERKYLTLRDGSLAGRVVGTFCFAQAIVSAHPEMANLPDIGVGRKI